MSGVQPTKKLTLEDFRARALEEVAPLLYHTIGMVAAVACIWFFEHMLTWVLGPEAKLFDVLPIRYLGHLGDLLAFVRFLVRLGKEIFT